MSQHQIRDSENYRVVFLGLGDASGAEIQAFAEKLSTAFRIPIEKALRITQKAPIVIKREISRSKAEQYQQFFVKLGGQVGIEQADSAAQPSPAPARPARVEGFETTAVESQGSVTQTPDARSKEQNLPRSDLAAKGYDQDIAGAYEEGFTPPGHGPSKPSKGPLFQCPQCGQKQQKGVECIKCGIIFEKHERMSQAESQPEVEPDQTPDEAEPALNDLKVKIEPAGFWVRLGAYMLDSVIIWLLMAAVVICLSILLGVRTDPRAIVSAANVTSLFFLFVPFAYFIYFLGKKGYTPGKGFLGLQVIRQNGTGISYGDAAIRTFSYILSALAFYLGFIWIGFDRNKHGWHDKIAKTQVIIAEDVAVWRKWVAFVPVILIPAVIVAAIAIPFYAGYASRADVVKAVSEMQTVKNHLEEYFYRYDQYPLTVEFRSFLTSSLGQVPTDPFNQGRPYRYESDGSAFTLWSIGPDKKDNGARILYDPFLQHGLQQEGDVIFRSDQGIEQSDELFGMAPPGADQWVTISE
jgi:uncharacterized RDD family membrane protein YckC